MPPLRTTVPVVTPKKWKLGDHQTYALEMMASNSSLGIFYDLGCGKTAIALMHIYNQVQKSKAKNALVVCPASLVGNWWDNVDKMLNFEGVTETGLKRLRDALTVTSFQKMYRTKKLANGRKRIEIREEIDHPWDILICDESHGLGSHSSIQSKAAIKLATMSFSRYIMTGTPVHGGGGKADYSKLYGQMRILEPGIWTTWTEFCKKYVTHYDFFGKPDSYNITACKQVMENHGIVCRIEQVWDMPEVTDTVIKCPLVEKKVYKDILKGALQDYGIDVVAGGNQFIRALQICSGSLKTDDGTMTLKTSKDSALEDLINGTDDKVVIFCQFKASIARVEKICQENGRKVVIIDGDHDKLGWKKFQYGDCDTIICQYQSGSAGLDLFASHTLIFFEPNLSAEKLRQALGRIYRKGQTRNCHYYYLYTPETSEAKAWDKVRAGESVSTMDLYDWACEEMGTRKKSKM